MRKQFLYITGSSGSGSNIIAKILSRVPGVLGVGETHLNFDHFLVEKFNEANHLTWDRHTDFKEHDYHFGRLKDLVSELEKLEQNKAITHVVFKRSILNGDQYRADGIDIQEQYPNTKTIIMYRGPEASAYSAHRRRLGKNLRHCAILQREQLTILARQAETDKNCLVIGYEDFCRSPENFVEQLAKFSGLPTEEVRTSTRDEEIDISKIDRWKEKLGEDLSARLTKYFSARKSQWIELKRKAAETKRS